tara:strand:+ start:441 stop:1640 length:1200 start_codon:yes stop_codon:yes gene_type:complete
MKRPTIIIIGVIIVTLLLGVWLYLLFGGNSAAPDENYADLNLPNSTDVIVTTNDDSTSQEPLIDINELEIIQQITTDSVIGFQEVQDTPTSTPFAYYVEPGVGNIYSINLETGEEKRISATTIPGASKAAITPDGNWALFQAGQGGSAAFSLGEVRASSTNLALEPINEAILDFASTKDNTFLYIARDGSGTVAIEYDPVTETSQALFSLPFNEVRMDWGSSRDDTHYIYPKANKHLPGYLYAFSDNTLKRLPVAGFGLTAVGSQESVLFAHQADETYQSGQYIIGEDTTTNTVAEFLPEKCTDLDTRDMFICGVSNEPFNYYTPDEWYEGTQTYSDNFWSIRPTALAGTYLRNITDETGRNLDITNLQAGFNSERVYFQNKNDGTLWIYHLDREPNSN